MEFTNYLNSLPISKRSRQNYQSDIRSFKTWLETMGKGPTNKVAKKYISTLKESGFKNSTIKRKTISLNHYAYFLKTSNALPTNFMSKQNFSFLPAPVLLIGISIPFFLSSFILAATSKQLTSSHNNQQNSLHTTTYSSFPKNKKINILLSANNPDLNNTKANYTAEIITNTPPIQ